MDLWKEIKVGWIEENVRIKYGSIKENERVNG